MLKKKTAILFISLAYAILLGHNIIPHHHHDPKEYFTVHQDTDHHHDVDSDDDGLNHLFFHFTHSVEDFSFTSSHNITNTFSKQQLSFITLLHDDLVLDNFVCRAVLDKPPADHLIYISPISHPSGLRAPPSTFI